MGSTDSDILQRKYTKGLIVTGRVGHFFSYGAEIRLDDGTKGIIRNRELWWGKAPRHPSEVLALGQVLRALVLKVDEARGRVELSLRQATKDPWHDIDQKYRIGQVLRRNVARILQAGAFVELEPGLDGFVPTREVCIPSPQHVDDVLWVGDTIDAIITRMDHTKRELDLSIAKHLRSLDKEREKFRYAESLTHSKHGLSLGEGLSEEARQALLRLLQQRSLEETKSTKEDQIDNGILPIRLRRVLLVDDDRSFRTSMQRLLKRFGHEVEPATSPQRAIELSVQNEYDLVLLDINFIDQEMNGIEAAKRILAVKPSLPVILFTGITWLERHGTALQEAQQIGIKSVLLKPIDWARFQHVLSCIVEGTDSWEAAQLPVKVGEGLEFFLDVTRLTSSQQVLTHTLEKYLHELQQSTDAAACVLFYVVLTTHEVHVFAHVGTPLRDHEASKYTLIASTRPW